MNDAGAWTFALELYQRPGVADACLALQDGLGVDVNLLLFALFAATERGVVFDHQDLAEADAVVRAWRAEVIQPLRALRQSMKVASTLAAGAAKDELRQLVKDAELRAEQLEVGMLTHWYGSALDPRRRRPSSAIGDLPMKVAAFFAVQSGRNAALISQAPLAQALETLQGALARPRTSDHEPKP